MDQSLLNYRIDKHFIDFCQEKSQWIVSKVKMYQSTLTFSRSILIVDIISTIPYILYMIEIIKNIGQKQKSTEIIGSYEQFKFTTWLIRNIKCWRIFKASIYDKIEIKDFYTIWLKLNSNYSGVSRTITRVPIKVCKWNKSFCQLLFC